ncbi:iron-siderophore ABC transporter substrate-binding protein [Rhodococcus artemisiae]|uniref:Iron-siderophore ABC transporter substrate-binding protein n=1 Tax=Rhodococcus artemisiae TaxID=714159 RepID=A0ABU7L7Y3_9NOCA|nr:iron-siderophore ABC transporter substrate-binding protein [Rhodococcus artemisiae]MEE2057648.1 iron-siderophore ABC transporter substrate-binding protein [Rhodococcus artemisiae]
MELPAHRVRIVALAATTAALALAGCSAPADDPASEIVRTTTRIAGAAVVGIERDTTTACALPSPTDPGLPAGSTHGVIHTAGVSEVPNDPQRIVVLDAASLDAVCALGLWERVVGVGIAPDERPEYLGTGVSEIPAIGSAGSPDLAAIEQARPDLIVGAAADTGLYDSLSSVAPTVVVGSDQVFWRQQFERVGESLGRSEAARRVLEEYSLAASELGRELTSSQTQASLVRFTGDGPTIDGTASFPGQVLADLGAARPAPQRFGVEDGRAYRPLDTEDPSPADGDVIFVRFDGPDGLDRGTEYMKRDEWLDLGAVTDNRLFSVSDEVWSTPGPVAAHAVLTDLRDSLNGYSN